MRWTSVWMAFLALSVLHFVQVDLQASVYPTQTCIVLHRHATLPRTEKAVVARLCALVIFRVHGVHSAEKPPGTVKRVFARMTIEAQAVIAHVHYLAIN